MNTGEEWRVISIQVDDAVTLTITTKLLTIHNTHDLLRQLLETAHNYDKRLVLDFTYVNTVDSTVISMLVEFNSHMKENNKQFTLKNLSPFIKKTFEILHITKYFDIE
jgi:anti-anti-sigma factor